MNQANEIKIEGLGTLPQGNFGNILVEGVGKGSGDLTFDTMSVEGKFHACGKTEGHRLRVEGVMSAERSVKVKDLLVNGFLQVKAENVYADRMEVNGVLKCRQEISADDIVVDGYVETELLCGDQIRLHYREVRKLERFLRFMGRQKPLKSVQRVECTRLEAGSFSCAHICAQEITLRHHCKIDVIECDGVITMDDTCTVQKMIGDYTLKKI